MCPADNTKAELRQNVYMSSFRGGRKAIRGLVRKMRMARLEVFGGWYGGGEVVVGLEEEEGVEEEEDMLTRGESLCA